MPQATKHVAIIICVATLVSFLNLGGPRLWDRDEPRNAGCAVEMLEANDWVVPRFNSEVRDHKPVLLYWFMMVSYAMFGVNEFSARFPSAFLAVCTVLLTYSLGKRLFNRDVAFCGAIILATTMMFTVAARAATPDSLLIFCVTLSLWTYVRFAFTAEGKSVSDQSHTNYYPVCWWQTALIFACTGLAVLAKGPVGLVLPTAIIGMFLLIMRLPENENTVQTWGDRLKSLSRPFAPIHFLKTCWQMKPITAILACAVVALPWYLWVAAREYSWITGFFLEHNFGRATEAHEGHSGPVFYYLLASCVGFFPWSVFFLPVLLEVVQAVKNRAKEHAGIIFLCCWIVVWTVAFSIASTKLPSYVTPMYPALALLTGYYINHRLKHTSAISTNWYYVAGSVLILIGIGFTIGFPLVAQTFLPGEELLGGIGLILLIGGFIAVAFQFRQQSQQSVISLLATSMLFVIAMFAIATQRVDSHQQNHKLLSAIKQHAPDSEIYSYYTLEPSWVFYSGKTVHEFHGDELTLLNWADSENSSVLITTSKIWNKFAEETQDSFNVIAREPYFLRKGDLLVLLPKSHVIETASKDESISNR